jgi:predicted nucleic acid-binding protein
VESAGLAVILDTSLLVEGERGGKEADALISRLETVFGESPIALSVVSVVEFTHGIYRAKQPEQRERRSRFAEDIFRVVTVYPVTFSIGMLAGRIHGEQMARGSTLDFADLLIGCTALHLGYDLATLNRKHFVDIPGVSVLSLPRALE